MSRWTNEQLAQALADNPSLRLSGHNRPLADRKAGQGKATNGQSEPALASVGLKEQGKRRKYRNEIVEVDGITFHSKREARRYSELKLLERQRVIVELDLQVRYPFVVHGIKICSYVADFTYEENGKFIVEDSKGFRTREYQIKKKLLKALFGYDIRET